MPQDPPPHDRRESERIDFVTEVKLQFEDLSGFAKEYSANISLGGMFIKSDDPKPVGATVSFEFLLRDDFPLIKGVGEVVWVQDQTGDPNNPPGMGIQFQALDDLGRALILQLMEEHLKRGGEPFDIRTRPEPRPMPELPPLGKPGSQTIAIPGGVLLPGEAVPEAGLAAREASNAPPLPEGSPAEAPALAEAEPPATPDFDTPPAVAVAPELPSVGAEEPPESDPSALEAPTLEMPLPGGLEEEGEPAPAESPFVDVSPPSAGDEAGRPFSLEPSAEDLPPLDVRPPGAAEIETMPPAAPPESSQAPPPEALDFELLPLPQQELGPEKAPAPHPPPRRRGEGGLPPVVSFPTSPGAARSSVVRPFLLLSLLILAGVGGGVWYLLSQLSGEVALLPDGRAMPAAPQGTPPPLGPAPRRAETPPRRQSTDAPTPTATAPTPEPTPDLPPASVTRIESIDWELRGGVTILVIRGNGPFDEGSYRHIRLEAGRVREVIKISNIDQPFEPATLELETPHVARIRSGLHPGSQGNELHLVVDLADPAVRITRAEHDGRTLRVELH